MQAVTGHADRMVSVHVEQRSPEVRIVVADDGQGVPPELRATLFEPFVTGHPDGTGLGLPIAREMAEAQHGRQEDIVPLAEHFLAPKRLASDAAALLLAHAWPGNVRELRNAMERAAAMTRQGTITGGDVGFLAASAAAEQGAADDLPAAVARLEEAMIRRALEACGGNRSEAARRLNIHRQLLHTKIRRYGIE